MSTGQNGGGTLHLQRSIFTVNHLEESKRYPVWRESLASIFDVELDPSRADLPFYGTVEAQRAGSIMTTQTRTRGMIWNRHAKTIARDGMDHYMIQVYRRGSMRFETARDGGKVKTGDVVVFDLAEEVFCQNVDFTNHALFVARPLLEPFLTRPDSQHTRVLNDREPLVAILRDHIGSLIRHGPRMTALDASETVPATLALAAACLNAGVWDEAEDANPNVSRPLLTLIKAHIEEHLTERSMTTDRLAADFGLSRSKLYRLFEPLGGVASYIRDRRLRRAMGTLMDREQANVPIYLIATQAGFGDETDFSRAFRRRFGFTPRDSRRFAEETSRAVTEDDSLHVERIYETWLHSLGAELTAGH